MPSPVIRAFSDILEYAICLQMQGLAITGGSTMKENVSRVMSYVLDHAVALQYNWAGKTSWKSHMDDVKRALGCLLLCSVIKCMHHHNFAYSTSQWGKKINNC